MSANCELARTESRTTPEVFESYGVHLSSLNRKFLEAVANNPVLLERKTFEVIHANNPLASLYPLQSWPTFISYEAVAELERVSVALGKLLKSVPERLMGNDPSRIARFYDFESPGLVQIGLVEPNGIEAAMSRCDMLLTSDGWKCLELNCGSFIGGWFTQAAEPLYRSCPATAAFLEGAGVAVRLANTIGQMFDHMISDTVQKGIWKGGAFNAALVLYPHMPEQEALHQPGLYAQEYQKALSRHKPPLDGRLFNCSFDDLRESQAMIYHGGDRVYAILEQSAWTERSVFRSFKAGRVNLFSGPITQLLSDKRNIALLSEHSQSDAFSREERELVQRHLPWSRNVAQGQVFFREGRVGMEDLLERHRDDLVLKYSRSVGGKDVFIGHTMAPEAWAALCKRALGEPGWIVQEFVASVPYYYQNGEQGAVPYDVLWGPFDFGSKYAGSFLRMQPRGGGGLINITYGAQVGLLFEAEV